MTNFFLDHLPGCTPIQPCASCRAVRFLEKKLTETDFATLLSIAQGNPTGTESGGSGYSADNPAPLSTQIDDIFPNLSTRLSNCLKDSSISTIGDLVKKAEKSLLRIPNFGRSSLREIKAALEKVGRHLADSLE